MADAAEALLAELHDWVAAGALRPLDLSLTRFIHRHAPESDPAVLLAVALTSERNGRGHVCLELERALSQPAALFGRLGDDPHRHAAVRQRLQHHLEELSVARWVERLEASPAVGRAAPEAADTTPLVIDRRDGPPRLYLRRYWRYEQTIRDHLSARLGAPVALDEAHLAPILDELFPAAKGDPDWQRLACALAARSRFFILTGGPGTGKTTTVVRLLALLHRLTAAADAPALRIELAAPTGKAAARLNESIVGQFETLPGSAADNAALPTQVQTLHRLLGPRPESRRFRHHAGQPLSADVVVVDEASMVDVEMMVHLLEALRPEARLILLGDKDQLASVEAGAVLGDLCRQASGGHYTPATCDWLTRVTGEHVPAALIDPDGPPLAQAVAMLRTSHRFSEQGHIGGLAACINAPTAPYTDSRAALQAVHAVLQRAAAHPGEHDQITAVRLDGPEDPQLAACVRDGYRSLLHCLHEAPVAGADPHVWDDWAQAVLQAHKRFQLLTPLRQGPWGTEGLNPQIVQLLRRAELLPDAPGDTDVRGFTGSTDPQWYVGRPVLVTRNDYTLNLMNGDIGVTLPHPRAGGGEPSARPALRVAFPDAQRGVRWVLPSRLQAVETVFAMTVHKSQGSEFEHTALVLPEQPNPILTRELLYTAITRSRQRFTLLYGDEDVLGQAVTARVERDSGLAEAALRL